MKTKHEGYRIFQGYSQVDFKKRTIDRDIYIQNINSVPADSWAMSTIGDMVRYCNRHGLNPLEEIGITIDTLKSFRK